MIAPLAYIAAFSSSVCFGLGSVLEQLGTRRVKALDSINPLDFIPLLKQVPYVTGLLLDGLGFVFFLIAVHALPLFFVQAVDTASIVVTAIGAKYLMAVRLTFKEYRLMAVVLAGLVLLSLSTAPEIAVPAGAGFRHGILYAAGGLVVLCAAAGKRLDRRPMVASLLSGLSFSGVAVVSRMLPGSLNLTALLVNPLVWALIVYGLLGILLFSMALQSGSVTHVYAVTFVAETVIPAIVGVLVLGDLPRNGLWGLMLAGLVVTVSGTTALALAKDYGHGTS